MTSLTSTEQAAGAASAQQEISRLAALPTVHAAMNWFRANEHALRDRQLEVAAIPAPPFGEAARSVWMRERFIELGLESVEIDAIGNVMGVRPGTDPDAGLVAVSAHLDTVFAAGTPLNVRRDGDRLLGGGISDNAAGITAVLGLMSAMRSADLQHKSSIVFIGNVGEEGEGDLRGMRAIFADPRWRDSIAYTVVIDGAATDTVVTQALGSKRFLVTVNGPGGHSWSDFGIPNPIVVLARAVARFSRVNIPAEPKTSCTIATISGGTSVNTIPDSASMKVDIRSVSNQEIERLEKALNDALAEAAAEFPARGKGRNNSRGISYQMELIGCRPTAELKPGARILPVIRAVDAHLGNAARLHRASTDANIPLSMGLEAISIGAGGSGGGAHTLQEWYDPAGRDLGLKRALLTVLALAGVP
jgi:tripeptide aminopeptidase